MADGTQERQRTFVWQNDETYLRNVEKEVLIPKKMRDNAKIKCAHYVDAFTKCCQDSGLAMAVKCRKENSDLKDCVTKHYKDPEFFEMCKQEYLAERAEFRTTGITKKEKKRRERQKAEQEAT